MKKVNENVKLKVIVYFLVGFLLNFFGLIIGGLWIKFKARTNLRPKITALVVGAAISLFLSYVVGPYFLEPQAERLLYSKFPEMQTVKDSVQAKYPDGKIGLGYSFFKSGSSGKTTSTLSISYSSQHQLSGKEMQDIGKLACTTLQSTGKNYDQVGIINVVSQIPVQIPFLYFNKTYRLVATCDEWLNKDLTHMLPSI